MRPTKICEEEIEKILAMSDEDEEDFSISESEFETNLLEEGMNSSEDDSSDNSEDWNEEPPPQAPQDNIIPFSKRFLRGKNKYKWATTKGKRRRSAINIVHHARGPTGAAKNVTDCAEVFKLFITDEILSIIVHYTNIEIEKRNGDFPTEKPVNKTELEALIGILILSAVMKDNHLTSRELFNKEYSGTRYISTMSRSRFSFLVSCLRFDDRSERVLHLNDRFAAIREVWDKFTQKCRDNFKPGLYLTVDEQLLAFRGRCLFRMYIPNKPAKYGLKIIMLCDSGTSYVVDAMPYLGKGTTSDKVPLGEYCVKEITKSVHGTNRNVTMDNWFTSIPLAKSLLQQPYNLTIVGTLRSNKAEIPEEMKQKKRKTKTAMFCYDNELTLLSYKAKPNKIVYLLSSCDEEGTINVSSGKPNLVEFYNKTKGGVDTLDQMCSVMSCSRKTKRWPMCMFYGILNIAFVNSYVIYVHNALSAKTKPLSRREFMKKLHSDLVKPHMAERLKNPNLHSELQQNIRDILSVPVEEASVENVPSKKKNKRKICSICPYKKHRMTKSVCSKCMKHVCGEHKVEICAYCAKL